MMHPTRQTGNAAAAYDQLPLLQVLSAATHEIWFLMTLSDRLIHCCSQRFLSIWNLPEELAALGAAALSMDSMASVRATALYGREMPAFGEFVEEIQSVVHGRKTGVVANLFNVSSHEVPDLSGLPVGNLVFLHPQMMIPHCPNSSASENRVLYGLEKLSPRERTILERLYCGATNRAISLQLQISQKTVEKHRSSAMKKLSASSFAELIRALTLAGFGSIGEI